MSDPTEIAFGKPFLPQDATFFSIELFRKVSPRVPLGLDNIFDTVLHRIAWSHQKPLLTDHVFSAMRWHDQQLTSNSQRRIEELAREDIMKLNPSYPFLLRILKRLSGSRLRPEVSSLIKSLLARGWLGASDIQASVYSTWDLKSRLCTVADVYAN